MLTHYTPVGERIVSRVSAFQKWAIANDCALTPALEFREVDNELTDTRYRAVRLPAMLVAEYQSGELVCVTPHCDGRTVRNVTDRLAELEAGDPTLFERIPVPEADAAPRFEDEDTPSEPEEPGLRLPQR